MKKTLTILAMLAISASFTQAADAEKKADKKAATAEERFKKIDTNADGSISLDELKASPMGQRNPDKVDENFKRRDKDSDGKLTMEEFAAGAKKGAEKAAAEKPAEAK